MHLSITRLFFYNTLFATLLLLTHATTNGQQKKANILNSSSEHLMEVQDRRKVIAATLKQIYPIILLANSKKEISVAQQIAINQGAFDQYLYSKKREPLLNEVFATYKALPSDLMSLKIKSEAVYRVEVYNYAYNLTVVAYVDVAKQVLLHTEMQPQSAPDVPEHLRKLAIAIAINDHTVTEALGADATPLKAEMASTKTALNKSKCERSQHLCVAPTFVKNNKALWAIVDLTDLQIVGTRWTNVGDAGPVRVTERTLQNEVMRSCYCDVINTVSKLGWQVQYNITSSDGLRIADCRYNNAIIIDNAKLVDWHVSYSNTDGFGYSDGIGCPTFSNSAVLATTPPKIVEINNAENKGFAIEQVFASEGWPRACNYNYVQRYEFYANGAFRISTASIGRGCGNDGIYRPVFRIVLHGKNTFTENKNYSWQKWTSEKWCLQTETTTYDKDGSAYRITGTTNYAVIPSRGQFNDNGRGDNAYVYVTKNKQSEGEQDLLTIGPCCNYNHEQGPEKFINNETIDSENIVLWYVPQMRNDDTKGAQYCWAEAAIENGVYKTYTYPCFAGPMFTPIMP
jgi:hypothetical protein